MRKVLFSIVFSILFFFGEFLIFNLVGRYFIPNLLLLLVVFITLAFGIRHGILTGIVCGLLKDSFSGSIFGMNIFVFVLCAFSAVFLKRRVKLQGLQTSCG